MVRSVNVLRVIVMLMLFITTSLHAQKTKIYTDKYTTYREALELYEKEKYSAAQEKFGEMIRLLNDPMDEVSINSEYYYAICALKLLHPDAEFLLQRFIDLHPESPQVKIVYFELGKFFFQKNTKSDYKKALAYFNRVEKENLNESQLNEFYYKRGYSLFQLKEFKEAALDFIKVKDAEGPYREPALYYYSYIAYTENKYQSALEGFQKLQSNEYFRNIVPYYIAQIYYLQGKYDEVVAYVPPILDSASGKQRTELLHLTGDSYYRLQKYDIAVPYLEQYIREVSPNRDENYQMGYAYYRSGFYSKAVPYLNKTVNVEDSMAQLAFYHLGDCYLRMNEKIYARNAYEGAAKLSFNPKIQEDATFSFAKLAYELSYNPFHEAITALEEYLKKYPNSPRREEAYSFLINVYITTRNYSSALKALDQVKNKDFRIQSAYQMVCFNYAVELFQQRKFNEAITYFTKVKTYPIDKKLNYESKYWIAESYYQLRDFDRAIDFFTQFQQEPGAFSSTLYNTANYNIAYSWYEKGMDKLEKLKEVQGIDELKNSLLNFKKFVTDKNEKDQVKMADAYLRIGDLHYIRKENESAIEYYNLAYRENSGRRDYALFQLSFCQYLIRKNQEAIDGYRKLVSEFPGSNYVSESIFEMGEVYREMENHPKAIESYQEYVNRYPANTKSRKAILYMAKIYYKQKNYAKSEDLYRKILRENPTADEIKTVVDGLQPVLTEQGRLDEWAALKKQYDKGDDQSVEISYADQVDKAYSAADCDKTIEYANKYVTLYPNGSSIRKIRFYRAECQSSQGRHDLAAPDYEFVLSYPDVEFAEQSNRRLAYYWQNKKDYVKALTYFLQLETTSSVASNKFDAVLGAMRCYYQTKDWAKTIEYAARVLKEAGLKDEIKGEAKLVTGISLFSQEEFDKAFTELKAASGILKGWYWAEARYYMAHVYYSKKDYKKCEKEIFEFVKIKPNFDYWLAKAYILLADNYLGLGDAFQAKATLKSVIDNYKGDDEIVPTAQAKYDAIIEQENNQNNQRKLQEDIDKGSEEIPGNNE
jgi:tetratricopeptide (TPR) repeat protein